MMGGTELVAKVEKYFTSQVENTLSKRLRSFYLVGSYVSGKISDQRPDINYLLIFDGITTPQEYLKIGKICKSVEEAFREKVTIKFEFRPFRYIKPKYKNDLEISIYPIITSTKEIKVMGNVIFNKWMTEGLKASNKLLLGDNLLKKIKTGKLSRDDLKRNSLLFFTLPLSRAPAQYTEDEHSLLLNESLVNAKNIAYFGVEAAMTDEELSKKEYIQYIRDKKKMVTFYKDRYEEDYASMVGRVLEVRDKYLKYKDDPSVAEEMFSIALRLGNVVRKKVYE